MPPHSEVENDPFDEITDKGSVKLRKRSRSKGSQPSDSEDSTSTGGWIRAQPEQDKVAVNQIVVFRPSIVSFHEAPDFLQFNEYIRNGYRTNLCTYTCMRSLFWWTNETLNAWTHLLGWVYFAYHTVQEIGLIGSESSWHDNIMMIVILVCFQICMAMSTGYHTFCCRSQNSYHCWLSYDLCGISFSLLAIYSTGIYYAFWCQNVTRIAYLAVSVAMFAGALTLQTNAKFLTDDYSKARLYFFMAWSSFGVLPCTHWALQNGGFAQPYVLDLVGRIGIMYVICGVALFFYVTRIPERWLPGWVDYIGSSHQWWHVIIFLAFYHWQQTGQYYAQFRAQHGCFEFHPDANSTSQPIGVWDWVSDQ